jgi:cardiolipin synthase
VDIILANLVADLLSRPLDLVEAALLLFNLAVVFAIVFVERRNPTVALAWVAVLLLFPYVGFVLYLLFGRHIYSERRFRLKGRDDRRVRDHVERQERALDRARVAFADPSVERFRPLMRLLLEEDRAVIWTGNRVEYEDRGEAHFAQMLAAIAGARDHVHMEYFAIDDDDLGRQFIAALAAKAREGVAVRLVYDDIGSSGTGRRFFRPLTDAGGRAVPFFPGLLGPINFRINFRNHRKILVVDGTVGFIGGFNIGLPYLGKGPLGPWRDAHLRIEGPAVRSLQARFLMDWNYSAREDLGFGEGFFPESSAAGGIVCQVASSGPDTPRMTIKEGFLKLIGSAEGTIEITTPYFVPDDSILDALRVAAVSGVRVRIMIPSRPDHLFVYWATLSYIGSLLDAGVRAFTYDRGFLHAKTCVVDGEVCTVGTANWDVRSFKLNFETNAFVYDRSVAAEVRSSFEQDLAFCTEITPEGYAARGRIQRIKESISRLFSPLL